MLATVVCAVLSGCRGYRAIAQWIHLQDVSLWHALGYFRTPPTRNCFRKLLLTIEPARLEAALWNWVIDGLGLKLSQDDLTAVTLDGKTLRGAVPEHERALHVLSLLDQATGAILRQAPVDPATNEAKAAIELLKSMVLKGKVVVADAMFCQREVCQQILDSGGEYLVTLKDNQPAVKREVEIAFAEPRSFSPLRPEAAA